jgi:arginyl-tRNA synthetase
MVKSGMTFEADGALWLDDRDRRRRRHGRPGDRRQGPRDAQVRRHYTYFVPDVAYHITKFRARLRQGDQRAGLRPLRHRGARARRAAGGRQGARHAVPRGYPDYLLHKMVRVMRGGEEVKMSKRAGSYVTLRDLLDWVGRDATRFFLVSRKADTEFVFDVDLALSQSEDNPVYYVQYAHARICSVLAQAADKGHAVPDEAAALKSDLMPLASAREQGLMNRLAEYPEVLAVAANDLAPHQLANYLKELAADFHGYYNAERVLVDEAATRAARLALLLATRQVLRNGLALLGVSAPEKM